MLKLTVEDYHNEFEVLYTHYFNTVQDANDYLSKCFPYSDKKVPECESSSFCILNGEDAVVGISTETISITDPNTVSKKVWNGNDSIFEIFTTPDVNIIRLAYKDYIEYIKSREEYVDSYRVGLVDDEESMRQYEELKTCCGSDDREISINGVKYMFGCNFGH